MRLQRLLLVGTLVAAACMTGASAEEWPTYQHDSARSGVSSQKVALPLREAWAYRPVHAPRPAWPGPAKRDLWNQVPDLNPLVTYDRAFHVAVAGGRVYFGSSADDQLRCLDAATGREVWSFFAEGPIRLAPTVVDGRVYFGADDGVVYCLNAATGEVVWKRLLAPAQRLVPGNGRMISAFACRTGVLVSSGVAYAAAGLIPETGVYLCALDAGSGDLIWRQKSESLSPQGYLMASLTRLFVPTGRTSPASFHRDTGVPAGALGGLSGSYAALVGDALVAAFGRGTGDLALSDPGTTERLASLSGRRLLVNGATAYLQTKSEIRALSRERYLDWAATERTLGSRRDALAAELADARAKKKDAEATALQGSVAKLDASLAEVRKRKESCTLWRQPCDCPYAFILAGDLLIAGGDGRVVAYSTAGGKAQWTAKVAGRAYGLAAAGGRLFVSTSTGAIYAFGPGAGKGVPAAAIVTAASPAQRPCPKLHLEPVANEGIPAGLVGRWVFAPKYLQGRSFSGLAGARPAMVRDSAQLEQDPAALRLAGEATSVCLGEGIAPEGLPRQQITVEGWIRPDEVTPWGGILGAIQDNGTFEKGWHLGSQGEHFRFAISSVGADDGDGKVTYLYAAESIEPGRWYHVAGTYDGTLQRIYVNGVLQATAQEQSGPILYPDRLHLQVGAYRDDNEFYSTVGAVMEVRLYDRALTAAEVKASFLAYAALNPPPLDLARGPLVEYQSETSARVRWAPREPGRQALEVTGPEGVASRPAPADARGECVVQLSGLVPEAEYRCRVLTVGGTPAATEEFLVETAPSDLPPLPRAVAASAPPDASSRQLAADILRQSGVSQGYCVVLGAGDGSLAMELARASNLRVVCIEEDPAVAQSARRMLAGAGLYGRVAVRCGSLADAAIADYAANLVVPQKAIRAGRLPEPARELARLLRPVGGTLVLGALKETQPGGAEDTDTWLGALRQAGEGPYEMAKRPAEDAGSPWRWSAVVRRGALPGVGSWVHMYADAGNSACSGEGRIRQPLQVQWFGRPGPRFLVDRHHRAIPPLADRGCLVIPGSSHLIGVDAYNGAQLWDVGIAGSRRVCGPRETSHVALGSGCVYVAARDRCWRLDLQTGASTACLEVPRPEGLSDHQWGYLAVVEQGLLGSGRRPGATHTAMSRGAISETYYDYRPVVSSDYLFCLDPASGKARWVYRGGAVVDTAIAVGQGRIFFIEGAPVDAGEPGRLPLSKLLAKECRLVALDLETGKVLFRTELPAPPWQHVLFLSYSRGTVVATGSYNKEGRAWYHLRAFDAASGEPRWSVDHPNSRPGTNGGHGEQDHHPAIVDGVIYAEPVAYRLADGVRVNPVGGTGEWQVPLRGGCGTLSASASALFYRDSNPTQYTLGAGGGSRKISSASRPSCWINIIPAGGLVLIPEGSSGCTCGYPIQASFAFAPVVPGP